MSVNNNTKFNLGEAYSQLMSEDVEDLFFLEDVEPEARKEELEKLGEEIIAAPRGERKITKKQFSLMHGDSFIKESDLEGGYPDQTLEYWRGLLIAWREGRSFIKEVLTLEEIEAIILDIEDAIAAYALIQEGKRDELLTLISDGLKSRGRFVVPIIYIGAQGGHGFTAVFELDGDNMICQLLNRGEGSGCHPAVEIVDGKVKRSYCSDLLLIPFEHFNEKTRAGQTFWDQLILYATTKPMSSTPDYCSKELYSYFYVLADKVIPIEADSVLGATPQKAGSCAEKIPELLVRQYLHRHDPEEVLKRRKRVLFATRFDSLLDAFHDLYLGYDTQNFYILKNSISVFEKLVLDLKKRHFITDQEVHLATALAKQVHRKLKEYENIYNASLDIPDLDQEFPVEFEEEMNPVIECPHAPLDPSKPPMPLPEIPQILDPEMLLEHLQNWVAFASEEEDQNRAFTFAYRAIQSLPIPTNDEDFWDAVPEEHISESLKLLEELTVVCLESLLLEKTKKRGSIYRKRPAALYDILTTLSAFSMVHKLCSRLDTLKLDGYGIYCSFPEFINSKPSFFYALGQDKTRFVEIQKYFKNLRNDKGELFGVNEYFNWNGMNLLKALRSNDFSLDENLSGARCHVNYLLHFLQGQEKSAENLGRLWEKEMPPEYYVLEHFAGLAYFERTDFLGVGRCERVLSEHQGANYINFLWKNSKKKKKWKLPDLSTKRRRGHRQGRYYHYGRTLSPCVDEYFLYATQLIPKDGICSFLHTSYDPYRGWDEKETPWKNYRRYTDLDENEISIFTNWDQDYVDDVDWTNVSDRQEFIKIAYTKNSSIKISSLVNWITAHVKRLDQKEIQNEVLSLLLKPPHLETAIKEEPYLAKQLRAALDEAIEYYLSKSYGHKTALFLLRTSYLVETQLLEIGDVEDCETRINVLRDKAQAFVENDKTPQTVRYEGALSLIYLYRNAKELSDDDVERLISVWLEVAFFKQDVDKKDIEKLVWFEYEIKILLSTHENILAEKMGDPVFVNSCFAKINAKFNLSEDVIWEGDYPQFRCADVSVDVLEGTVFVANGGLVTNWKEIIGDMDFISRLTEITPLTNDAPLFYDEEGGEFWSEDLSLHMFLHDSRWILERQFVINRERKWYQCDFVEELGYQTWRACGNDTTEGLIHDGSKNEFFAAFTIGENESLTFHRLDQKGNHTGETLANVGNFVTEGDELDTFLKFLELDIHNIYSCRIWLKEGKLSSIVLDKLDLEFKYHDETKQLEALSFPGYYLDQQGFQSFLSLKTALVLKNARGEKKVLLPLWNFQVKSRKGTSYALKLSPAEARYCLFDLDEKQELLVSRDKNANFYLVTLLAASGDFENAVRYLDRLNPLQFYSADIDRRILSEFLKIASSFNPLRSAFIVRLALHYIENRNLRIAGRYQNRLQPEKMDRLWEAILQHANFLLETNMLKEKGHLPHYLSLTIEDFQKIYEFIEDAMSKTQCLYFPEETYNAFEKLERLIVFFKNPSTENRNSWEKVVNMPNLRWTIKLGRCPITPGVLHVTEDNFVGQFLTFYNEFVQEKDPQVAQMKFLPLLYSASHTVLNCLVTLLNIVRQNPTAFEVIDEDTIDLLAILPDAKPLEDPSLFSHKMEDFTESSLTGERSPRKDPMKKEAFTATKVTQITTFPLEKIASGEKDDEESGFFSERAAKYQEEAPFALADATLAPTTQLEQEIFNDLMTGHVENKERDVYFYDLKDGRTIGDLDKALEDQISDDSDEAALLKKTIEKAANKNIAKKENVTAKELAKADRHRLKKYWQQRAKMDFARHILPAFIMQDASLLKKHNPFLTDDEIEAIFNNIADYMLLMSRIDQAKEAKKKIQNGETVQAIGAVIHKKRLYEPLEYPELLVYEYASGFVLRESQVELLKWILEEKDTAKRKELLVEFQAGGGKTKVISAILLFLAYKEGKMPVFYSLPSLHDITKDDLRSALSSIFNLKLAVLEFRLTTKLSTEELEGILEDLHRWRKEGYALQVTPEVYHALYLNYQFALRCEDEQRVAVTGAIRKFFLDYGYFIIDEAHRNTTALWQANMTTGDAIHLSKEEQDLFVMCYQALTGNTPESLLDEDGREVHKLLEITSNHQAKLLPEDLPKVLRALAEWICEYYDVEPTDEIIACLTTKTVPIPEEILSMQESGDAETADLLFLARGILTEILPITLSLVGGFDHGGSIRENDEIESPRYGKAPSNSQYETAEIAAALCNQGLYQRGVNASQMAKLFEKIVHRHSYGDQTAQFLFEKWTKGKKIPFDLDEVDVKDRSQMTLLAKEIGKHPEVIEHYLRYHLLHQIKIYIIKLTSTAPALVDGGVNTILVSATIGRKEEYPKTDDQQGDLPFQAAVVQRALSREENSGLHWVDTASPKELYTRLYEENDAIFEDLEGMIDVGGMNIRYTTEEMAEQFLDFAQEEDLDYFGALYIQEETGSSSDKQQLTLIRQDTREHIVLHGSNLYQALRRAGYKNPEKLKLFKVYGPTQCTGTDLKLTPSAKMLILFSESTSLWGLIQALMRMRGFIDPLDPENPDQPTQSCVFVGPKKLEQKMSPDKTGEITPKSVFMYALSKEGGSTEDRIIARAFQQIAHEHRRFIDQKMMQAETAQEQIDLYAEHVNAFEEVYERNLQALFGNPEIDQNTETVLEGFAKAFREGAEISEEEWKENERGVALIAQVIAETTALVPQVRQKKDLTSTSTSNNVGEQKTEEVGDEEDQNKALRLTKNQEYSHLKSAPLRDYANNECSITSPILTTSAASVNETFETNLFSEELYILPDAYKTVEKGKFLKNFEYLLVVFEDDKRYVYLTSRHDAEIYQKQLIDKKSKGCRLKRKVALFTSQGLLAQNGRGRLAIPEKTVEEIRDSLWLRRICTDVALLNGKIYDFEFFGKQMSEWIATESGEEEFSHFFNSLLEVQGTPEEAHVAAVEYYLGQAVIGRTELFTDDEWTLIKSPNFEIFEEEEMMTESSSSESIEEEETEKSSSLSEDLSSIDDESSTSQISQEEEEDVAEKGSSSSEDLVVIVESSSSSENIEEEEIKTKSSSSESIEEEDTEESSSSSESKQSSSEEDIGINEVVTIKRSIKVLPIIGGLVIITALVLALITGGWGAAAYFAPINIANIWIYVSLGVGGGLSLLLFSGGSSLTLYGCLKQKQQEVPTQV